MSETVLAGRRAGKTRDAMVRSSFGYWCSERSAPIAVTPLL